MFLALRGYMPIIRAINYIYISIYGCHDKCCISKLKFKI